MESSGASKETLDGSSVTSWSADKVYQWACRIVAETHANKLLEQEIDGDVLSGLIIVSS